VLEQSRLSRRQFLARTGGAGAAAMFGVTIAACGDNEKPGAKSAGGLRTVKIIHPSDVTLVLWAVDYLSEDMGLYKDEGLAIKRVALLGGPVALTGLISGAGEGNISTPGEMLGAVAKGQRVKALMAHTNRTAATLVVGERFAKKLGVTADSSPGDKTSALAAAKGARLAITTPGSLTDGLTRMVLKQAGLDAGSDARIVPLQTAANSLAALENDQIDGFVALSPVTEQAVIKMKAIPLLATATGDIREGYRMQGQTLMARAADIEGNPDLYAAVVRANVRAMRVLLETPDKARDLLRKTRFADVDEQMWKVMWASNLPTWTSPFIARDALAAWVENGLIAGQSDPSKFPFDQAVDTRFVDDAARAINWKPPRV
jgi:ABC-type nitrate/sulfonate/bicarbonate transport system substrate-binding protein